MLIKKVKGRQLLDSRGNPTVEAELITPKGSFYAIVPSGASTGEHEAVELRDKNKAFNGKGVLKAVRNINSNINKKIKGKNFSSIEELDSALINLDGTTNKKKLGANAILPVSLAFARALAHQNNMPLFEFIGKAYGNKKFNLPCIQSNVINGGKHAASENDIQEHMIMPLRFKNFSSALQATTETYHSLKKLLIKKYGGTASLIADEGGFAPKIFSTEERLKLVQKAVAEAGYKNKIVFALDAASSEFFNSKKNCYQLGKKSFSAEKLIEYYYKLTKKFPILSIEDGLDENDWLSWSVMNETLGKKVQIVGDDLLTTNPERIEFALQISACNSLLLKVNQIGTLTESLEAAALAHENGWEVVVSHRSGETNDSFIADLAVGIGASQVKFGAPARSDRNSKYNQLLRIEEHLSENNFKPEYQGNYLAKKFKL